MTLFDMIVELDEYQIWEGGHPWLHAIQVGYCIARTAGGPTLMVTLKDNDEDEGVIIYGH